MPLVRWTLMIMACLTFTAELATAAAGGNAGGPAPGGGGGSSRSTEDLNAVFSEGTKLLEEGDCEQAEKKFRKVLKAVSKNPEANFLCGMALQCQGEHKSATRYLKRATRYDKKLYSAYQLLGVSYLEIGKRKDAEKQLGLLERILEECGPNCPEKAQRAHAQLDAALRGTTRTETETETEAESRADPSEESKDQHGLLFEVEGDPQTVYLGAVQLINSQRFVESIDQLRELSMKIGPHPDVLNYLGYAHRRLGLVDVAQQYYEQALSIDPEHRGANEYLGEMWVEQGRFDDARKRLSVLDRACPFGCAEYDDLERLIGAALAAAQ